MSENEATVKGFFLYFDQCESIFRLPDDQAMGVIRACHDYMLGKEPDLTNPVVCCVFQLVRPTLEKSKKRALYGKKGGQANGKQTVSKEEANCKQNGSKPEANESYLKTKNQDQDITSLREVVDSEADDASPDTCAGVAPCPHREIIAAYHAELPTLAKVKIWEGTRQKNLQARWRSCWERGKYATTVDGIAYWRRLFRFIHDKCPFLMGEVTSRDGKTWRADLGWLVKPENFAKLIEGKYDARSEA